MPFAYARLVLLFALPVLISAPAALAQGNPTKGPADAAGVLAQLFGQPAPPAPTALDPQTGDRPDRGQRPRSAQPRATAPRAETEAVATERRSFQAMNATTVGVISGNINGTYIRIAADLASVLDGDDLRVIPMIGRGAVQNITDILYLKGVDIGIVQSDVLASMKRERTFAGIEGRVHFIAKLYNEEVHVLARREFRSLADLAGQKVNIDGSGTGTAMTSRVIFDALGIKIAETNYEQPVAVEKLKAGEIAATIYVAGKPARLYTDLKDDTLHFVPVTYVPALRDAYLPSRLTDKDYPNLVPPGARIDSLAVGAVMAVFAWPQGSERYERVARLVDALFSRIHEFQKPPRHPKWQEVNLAADVPGWTRFRAAQLWLDGQRRTASSGGDPDDRRR